MYSNNTNLCGTRRNAYLTGSPNATNKWPCWNAEVISISNNKTNQKAYPGGSIRNTFSCKSLAYLLSLSLQRLQVVGHSFQLLFKLRTFAVISEGRQERGGWKIQSSKRNRRKKKGEKIEKNETTTEQKNGLKSSWIHHRLKATVYDAKFHFKCAFQQWPDVSYLQSLAYTEIFTKLLQIRQFSFFLAAQETSFKGKKWINKKETKENNQSKMQGSREHSEDLFATEWANWLWKLKDSGCS